MKKQEKKTISIKHYPSNYKEEDIRNLCSKFGNIITIKSVGTESSIIEFENQEMAASARTGLHNIYLDNKYLLFADYFEMDIIV